MKSRGNLLGKSYTTPTGNTLTPVKYFTEKQKGRYVLECSVCSLDKELFPLGSLTTSNDSVREKRTVCGCNRKYKWSKTQYLVRIKRRCKELGYIFNGFVGEYLGCETKLDLYNPSTNNTWNTTCVQTFLLYGTGDPVEGTQRMAESCKKGDNYFIDKFRSTGRFKEDVQFKRLYKDTWEYTCPVCSFDDFVKAGVCTGKFIATQGHLSEGKLACRCNKNFKSTPEQLTYMIRKAVSGIGGVFLDWMGDNRTKRYGRFSWKCREGHTNESPVGYFLKTQNCKTCFANGYKNHLPARLYLVQWKSEDGGYTCLKYGITNLSVRSRVVNQKRKSNLIPTVLYTFYHEDGKVIENCEKQIKSSVGGNYCSRELLPRGFSETIENTPESIDRVLSVVKEFGLIEQEVIPY